jgi:hypothetical protein
MAKLSLTLALFLAALAPVGAQTDPAKDENTPLFDFEEFVVNYHPTDFAPAFRVENPQFTYYESPQLDRGELILALEFMDRYREGVIPGQHKWSGMLHFPVVDGEDRMHLKWLCLYFYNDRMFGYDPSSEYKSDRRFFVPISYENRLDKDVLFQFASSYVESIYPAREDEIYLYENEVDPYDPDSGFTEVIETIYIDAGRIAPVLSSQKGKDAKQLVRLIYQYGVDPNPDAGTTVAFGPPEDFGKSEFSWAAVGEELLGYKDNIEIARQLLAPRWSQKIYFHYTRDLWILPDQEAKVSALLFNIGTRLYVYSPKYGVWRTGATINDLAQRERLTAKLKYPGINEIDRVEFVPFKEKKAAKEAG